MFYKIKCVFILLFCSCAVFSQTPIEDEINNYLVWFINENNESSVDINELKDAINQYVENPISLNTCTYEKLNQLLFITSYQAYQIIRYRKKYGFFIHKYELLAVPGIALRDYKLIKHLFTLETHIYIKKRKQLIRSKFIIGQNSALHSQKEYKQNTYKGNPQKFFSKIDINSSEGLRLGFQIEKDAGEEFNSEKLDYFAGFLELKFNKGIERLIIGDYKLQYGQGITLNNYFTIYSSNSINHNVLNKNNFKVHSSLNETHFFRGFVARLPIKRINIDLFYSNRNKDANIDNHQIVSFNNSGYHRTISEITNKNSFNDQHFGGNLSYRHKQFTIGIVSVYNKINKEVDFQRLYQQNYYLKKHNIYNGVYFNYQLKNVDLFGEISFNSNFNSSGIVGLTHHLSPVFSYHVSYRNYHSAYFNRNSNAYGKNSFNNNEEGVVLKTEIKISSKFDLITNVDFYDRRDISYQKYYPTKGFSFFVQLNYYINNQSNFLLGFKKSSDQYSQSNSILYSLNKQYSKKLYIKYRYQFDDSFIQNFQFQTIHYYTDIKYTGMLIYYELVKKWKKISFTTRYTYFNTDNYNTRLYTYQNNVPYQYHIPMFYGKGFQVFGLFKFQINKNLKYGLKISYQKNHLNNLHISLNTDNLYPQKVFVYNSLVLKF